MNATRSVRHWYQRSAVIAVLVGVVALCVAGLIPLLSASRLPTVNAASSDVIVVSEPIQLTVAPSIVLQSGRLVAGQRSAGGTRTLVLEEGRFLVDLSATAERFGEFSTITAETGRTPVPARTAYSQLTALGFDRIKILSASAQIRWDGHFGIEIADLGLDLKPRRTGPVTATGTFSFRGEPVEFSLAVGNWTAVDFEKRKFGQRASLGSRSGDVFGPTTKAKLKSRNDSFTFDGQLALSNNIVAAAGEIDANVGNPSKLLAAFGFLGVDDLKIEPVALSGQVVWRDKQITSDTATLRIGDQTATGAVVLGLRDNRPLIEGTLSLDRLDLAPYFSPLKRRPDGGSNASAWPDTEVDFRVVRSIDADVRLSTSQLYAGENLIGRGSATIAIRNGKLNADIADLELQTLKGTMQLNADMMGKSPIYSIRSRFETIETGWLARALSIEANIRGKTIGTTDLTGTGTTLGQLLENARGKVTLKATEGAVVPVNTIALRAIARNNREPSAKEWKAILSDTKVEEIDIRCHILNGRVVIDRAHIVENGFQTALSGSVDRTTRAIEGKIIAGPTPSNEKGATRGTRAGSESESSSMRVRGTTELPKLELAPSGPAQ